MTEITTNGIVKWTKEDPASLVQESQAQGDSIDAQLALRERYDFVWATSAERTSQLGMTQGSRGYQVDVKAEYIYDNSVWRLAFGYYEGTSSTGSVATANSAAIFNFSEATATTDSNMVNAFTNTNQGAIFLQPGLYCISLIGKENGSAACTGQSQLVISSSSSFATVSGRISNNLFGGALMATCVLPYFRVTAGGTGLYFYFYNESGANRTINATLSIGRLA